MSDTTHGTTARTPGPGDHAGHAPAHEADAAGHGHAGHDDHGGHAPGLGPIDWAAWGAGILGVGAGVVVAACLYLSTSVA